MSRAWKVSAISALVTTTVAAAALVAVLAWLVRTEQGSRWLLEQGLDLLPVTTEVSGISGNLAEGMKVEHLYIGLPDADIRAKGIRASLKLAGLLAGIVDIDHAQVDELGIDIKMTDGEAEPIDDLLFWLQVPVRLDIAAANLGRLRIDKAEFEELRAAGRFGLGRLDIESFEGRAYGFELHGTGELAGPAPGRLHALVSWEMPAQQLSGSGDFNGTIDRLDFNHVVHVPEPVSFDGTIHDLFRSPALSGLAQWEGLRLPGEQALYSKAGRFSVESDFLSARIEGNHTVLLEDWPAAPMQLKAYVEPEGITVDSYRVNALDGDIAGQGRFEFGDVLKGRVEINGSRINTALLNDAFKGQLGFISVLLIESPDELVIDVSSARALVADRNFTGQGRASILKGRLSSADARIDAGRNTLTAKLELDRQLAGRVDLSAPELALLWPGLRGAADASVELSGTPDRPRGRVTGSAKAVAYDALSAESVRVSGTFEAAGRVDATLAATGLVADKRKLGNLDTTVSGKLADHELDLNLAGGVVAIALQGEGGWDGQYLNQEFNSGRIQFEGFDAWRLDQAARLALSAGDGRLSSHCWKQADAALCIADSAWGEGSLKSAVTMNDFSLATLQPLLDQGYSIEGEVDAELTLQRDAAGLQGELRWRQSRTVLGYTDEIDSLTTVLDEVRIDVKSDSKATVLDAGLKGDQGLDIGATARVDGPLASESPLRAAAKGRLHSIGLLRPLLQRVVNPGELGGELTVDLSVAGTLGDPIFTGGASLADGRLGLLGAGVTLSDINVTAVSKGGDRLLVNGELASGTGKAEILGEIRSSEGADLVADIRIRGENLASVRTPDLSVDTSPDLRLHIGGGVFDITGMVRIPDAHAQIRGLPQGAVQKSADVVVHGPDLEAIPEQETIVTADVEVILGDNVRFSGFGLNSRLDGALRLRQSRGGYLRSSGTVRVREGFLTGYGKELRVDRGELTFTGPLDDPLINIQVSRESVYEGRQYTIGLRLTGSAQNVKTEPFSRPAMSERDVLSFLLLDRPGTSDADASGAALALGLQQLVPDQSGRFGLDEVGFETNDANEAAMVAGKRINENLHVRYVFGSLGAPGSFRIRYRLGRGFSLEASTGSRQSLDLIYLLER